MMIKKDKQGIVPVNDASETENEMEPTTLGAGLFGFTRTVPPRTPSFANAERFADFFSPRCTCSRNSEPAQPGRSQTADSQRENA